MVQIFSWHVPAWPSGVLVPGQTTVAAIFCWLHTSSEKSPVHPQPLAFPADNAAIHFLWHGFAMRVEKN
jgi:hypothetical protein